MFKGAKVRYVDTTKSSSISTEVYYNNMLADNKKEKISITMDKTTTAKKYGIYDDTVGKIINTEELEVGDIKKVKGYYPRYISKKYVSTYTRDFEFTILNKIRVTDKSMIDIMNAGTTEAAYCQLGDLLIQWGVVTNAHGDTTNWRVEYPTSFLWYPAVILQTKDINMGTQGIPYSNGAVITDYDRGKSFTFQLRRSETCPVYWIAVGGAAY